MDLSSWHTHRRVQSENHPSALLRPSLALPASRLLRDHRARLFLPTHPVGRHRNLQPVDGGLPDNREALQVGKPADLYGRRRALTLRVPDHLRLSLHELRHDDG